MKRTLACLTLCLPLAAANAQSVGIFSTAADVGETPQKGKASFNAATGEYTVTGGGANIWGAADAFYFVSKPLSGDLAITADVRFIGQGTVAHRKAALMVRQSLDANSAYADVAVHGDGLTSLQFRPTTAAATQEIRSELKGPIRLRIERRGNTFTLFAGAPGETLQPTAPATIALQDPVQIGLAVGSHDANILETAVFSNVKVEPLAPLAAQIAPTRYGSKISVYDLRDRSVHVLYETSATFEAPNWSLDGKYLLSNSAGRLFRIPISAPESATPIPLPLDPALRCNNDHGFSPDGKQIAFSASSPTSRQSQVYVANADGSAARMVVSAAPSYFHGWSPDGKYLSVVAQRNGNFDIFRVPAAGGPEQRLTVSPGYDDGSDYSPDGKWIYLNSDRSGSWDIWRIPAEGAGPNDAAAQQVTSDEWEDWFPHPSPDGKQLLFLSFPKGTAGHNGKLDVLLRMSPLPTETPKAAAPETLLKFFGGQGTINVNSWSPDSTRFAFVSYLPAE